MIVTRHISLDEGCIKKMEQLVNKHNGNFSSAMRELITRSDGFLPKNTTAIDEHILDWMLDEIDGKLIPDDVLDKIINPLLNRNLNNLEKYINNRIKEFEWKVNVKIEYDKIESPSNILVKIDGIYNKARLIAATISQFLVRRSPNNFAVISVSNLENHIKVELCKSTNKNEAENSLITFFGGFEELSIAIKNKPEFWKCVVNRHVLSNYQMITVHRNYYEDILSGKVPMGEIMIETLAKKPVREIPLKQMLSLIKQVYEAARVVNKVEIQDEKIIMYHTYRNNEAIDKLKKSIVLLLEENGHLYDAKSTASMIVIDHRKEIGMKINEIVNNLRVSNSSLDQELIMFLSFLKGIKDIYDKDMSVTLLGRRIGTTLMQEYEKENNVKQWSLENFKKAFETIDSKIHRDSECVFEGKNLLYRIRKCNIASENDFDAYICRTAREAFKGALYYAFGNRAELEVKKLISHGDSMCEVSIRVH